MPELAAVYFLGVALCYTATAFFYWLTRRRLERTEAVVLRNNLGKAGLYWSESSERLVPFTKAAEAEDRKQLNKTILISGFLLAAVSWAGLALFLIVMFSFHVVARSRLEQGLYASELSTDSTLTPEQTKAAVDRIVLSVTGKPFAGVCPE